MKILLYEMLIKIYYVSKVSLICFSVLSLVSKVKTAINAILRAIIPEYNQNMMEGSLPPAVITPNNICKNQISQYILKARASAYMLKTSVKKTHMTGQYRQL